ncbi:MAG: tetratricopeptide repeat protein [Bacteroidota bacterium]|jgi:tetratricopeptide (TPR) repeat protein
MTDNHLLLYRLGELMLQHEQHVLPVDLLFEDEQIGDFVKSIQIDSPYQQMLLEGVLTESVRDEKLNVSFTVEGYFHFVLGEVIYSQIGNNEARELKKIVEEKKLKGIKEGVGQCLIRDVITGNLSRVVNLIDLGIQDRALCVMPLSQAFIINYSTSTNTILNEKNIQGLIFKLLENSTINDLEILLELILYLEKLLKNTLVCSIYVLLNDFLKSNSIEAVKILCNSIQYIPIERRLSKIDTLIKDLEKFKNHFEYYDVLVELGSQYYLLEDYGKAISCYLTAVDNLLINYEENRGRIQKIYNNLGAAYWRINNLEIANKYFNLTYSICIEMYGKNHLTTSIANFNLGIIEASLEKCDNSLSIFNEVLKVELSYYGKNHVITARTISNIGSVYLQMKDYETAYKLFSQALSIDIKLLKASHPSIGLDYDDLGDVYMGFNDLEKAKISYAKALEIFILNNGPEHSHSKLLMNKLKEINDT